MDYSLCHSLTLVLLTSGSLVIGRLLVKDDPTTVAGYFEGDIMGIDEKTAKNLEMRESESWKNRRVPYKISVELTFLSKKALKKAISQIERRTCLQFPEVTGALPEDYVSFESGSGCASYIGKTGGKQVVIIGPDCHEVGDVLHTLMHMLGFWHENSRTDRDKYILVNWENIKDSDAKNFGSYTSPDSVYGLPYDLNSVTHLSSYAFAKSKKEPTIMAKKASNIESRIDLTIYDIQKINIRYCGQHAPYMEARNKPAEEDPSASGKNYGRCSDKLDKCALWATQGKCYTVGLKMRTVCPQSCLICRGGAQTCKDEHTLCDLWKHMGECLGHQRYHVMELCPATCGICRTAGQPAEASTCRDKSTKCQTTATKRQCKNEYFKYHCMRTCKMC